ncbi:MAG: DUF4167 domain-containing protein [Paracoccaceae bacterium]
MRSSKSRSRSKNNRNNNNNNNRSVGNIPNRVFDSSGPEGKVRGTPQQIIDKYLQLTRDAQLANDRVAAENFQQHAEHYTRLLTIGMREMEAKREQQEREQRDRQRSRDEQHQKNQQREAQQREDRERNAAAAVAAEPVVADPAIADQPDVVEAAPESDSDSGLVATPEEAPKPKRRAPRRRKPDAEPATEEAAPDAPKTAAE